MIFYNLGARVWLLKRNTGDTFPLDKMLILKMIKNLFGKSISNFLNGMRIT